MPLINGMKMACEPCIRGHRSTKCTHANERLMVPVRKPGRPLSQCPHPRDQSCGCGTVVTAAIPRKQTCGCGTANTAISSQSSSPQSLPLTTNGTPVDASSPTRTNFKVQKAARPHSSRKQSFDIANLERMDMNNVNVVPFQQQAVAPTMVANGYSFPGYPQAYGYIPQFATMQPHIGHFQMPPPPLPLGVDAMMSHIPRMNGYSNGLPHSGHGPEVESLLVTPKAEEPRAIHPTNGPSSCCQPNPPPASAAEISTTSNGGSCWPPKTKGHSHTSSTDSIPEEPAQSSCCAPKPTKKPKPEPISASSTPLMQPQMLMQSSIPFNPALYQQYMPQPTVFTYPATYGSFQNPLQPDAWRESMRNNNFIQQQQQIVPQAGASTFEAPVIPGTMDTIHTCACGDSCSCIGCAAHPYNDETKEYIRSAWDAMNLDAQPADAYTNGQNHPGAESGGLNGNVPHQNGDFVGSPTANTPSSSNSANGEEQSLSAADFFFVSYPFAGDGCGGDTNNCPCGEDCQCLGCTIHNHDLGTSESLT